MTCRITLFSLVPTCFLFFVNNNAPFYDFLPGFIVLLAGALKSLSSCGKKKPTGRQIESSDECQGGRGGERCGDRIMDKRPQSQTQTLPEVRKW